LKDRIFSIFKAYIREKLMILFGIMAANVVKIAIRRAIPIKKQPKSSNEKPIMG